MRALGKFILALVLIAGVMTGVGAFQFDEQPAQFWARVGAAARGQATLDERAVAGQAPLPVQAGFAAKHAPPAGGRSIHPPEGPETSVLFIGNSLVYSHAMPQMVERLAWSDGVNLRADQRTQGGWTMQQHAASAETRSAITSRDWTYVVIQEQSRLPALDRGTVESRVIPGATNLAMAVGGVRGARLFLYMTPAWRDGDPEWARQTGQPPTSAAMQERLAATYTLLANRLGGTLVPAGAAWQWVRANRPDINLYDDNVHPSRAGAYLIACAFYRALTGRSPVGNRYVADLDPSTAALLQQAAARQ